MIETVVLVLVVLLLLAAVFGSSGHRLGRLRWGGLPRAQRGLLGAVILVLVVLILTRTFTHGLL